MADEFDQLLEEIESVALVIEDVKTLPSVQTSTPAPAPAPTPIATPAPVSPRGNEPVSPRGILGGARIGAPAPSTSPSPSPAPGFVAGPGAGRGTVSAGPGAGRGVMSSGPGAGRGGMSCGPGAGRGLSFGPGVAKPWAPQGTLPSTQAPLFSPDGKPVVQNGPPCAKCGEMIIGNVSTALGKTWHPEHFACFHCGMPFSGNFVVHNDKPYCTEDYFELFGERCARCLTPIKATKISKYGKVYHPEHFTCEGCGVALASKQYMEDESCPYCVPCKKARDLRNRDNRKICYTCNERINGDALLLAGQWHHFEHFKCTSCLGQVGLNYGESNGKIYCNTCIRNILKNICWHCGEPVHGRTISALGHIYHPEHFVCYHCHEPFSGGNFREHDGKPYCLTHYKGLTQLYCTGKEDGVFVFQISSL
eukprot:TRINITY_DN4843_c0_g3_i7.p1 TRINITY_DN4843_c0_g3~~TRINITY_DN4843_c0_g3_i7.p1  ORF type:complete len:421 (-),score=66.20 TRINITY_DN4843_c0_g3_i7:2-1264(-)